MLTLYPTVACVYFLEESFSTAASSERISILSTFEVSPVKFLVRSSTVTVYSAATTLAVVRMVIVFPSSENATLSVSTALLPRVTFTVLFVASKFVVTVMVLTPVWVADEIALTTSSGFCSFSAMTATLRLRTLFSENFYR